jgi:hydroxymethylbilane synthase
MERGVIRIGTRGSALALVQARWVQAHLPGESEIVIIKTTGDQRQDVRLDLVGGVGLFTKEIERALLDDEIDLAVHSLKDLPVEQPPGLVLGAIPERAPVPDLLLVRPDALEPNEEIPLLPGARVGTSSTRRVALLSGLRPELLTVAIRGTVPTRIRKCLEGRCEAVLLAQAGIQRMDADLGGLVPYQLSPRFWPCAPGQGALGLEIRSDDEATAARVASLDHAETRACAQAERRLLQISGGGCHSAFGAWASLDGDRACLHLALLTAGGSLRLRRFEASTLVSIIQDAGDWLREGAPAVEPLERAPEDWLCRPAPAWS